VPLHNIYGEVVTNEEFPWAKCQYTNYDYALTQPYTITKELAEELRYATKHLTNIFNKVVNNLKPADENILKMLGIPKELIDIVRFSPNLLCTLIGRFDFIETDNGIKMLEFNADTPCAIVESFLVNKKICDYYNLKNPNEENLKDIENSFHQYIELYKNLGYNVKNVFFSSIDTHFEDIGTTKFLLQASNTNGKYVPLKDLKIYKDKLFALDGDNLYPVDVLYRLHPLCFFVNDKDETGYPTGIELLKLVQKKRLALINPPSALIAQVKSLQALIWHLKDNFFSQSEKHIIEKYMLPTYMENDFINEEYVVKPFYGREGGGISIYDANQQLIEKDTGNDYFDQEMIYQKYVHGNTITVKSETGFKILKKIFGCFSLNGEASAIYLRVGGNITSGNSKNVHFQPISF